MNSFVKTPNPALGIKLSLISKSNVPFLYQIDFFLN